MSERTPTLPVFEELYVVSDLHLGGTQGQPIFRQGKQLAALIDWIAARTVDGDIALLLNGDVVDTLAENPPSYVASPEDAERIVGQIRKHAAFSPVFDALSNFVKQPRHRLVFVLGNHDLELSYPNVQERMLRLLAGEAGEADDAARGRVTFATLGTGYGCHVGTEVTGLAHAVCVHGNEFDKWNAVAPESLTRIVRASVLGKKSALLTTAPNAGTELVLDVMNAVKKDWPFVDLLKPEQEMVFTVLLALDPKRASALSGVFRGVAKSTSTGGWRVNRVLGASDAEAAERLADVSVKWAPGPEFSRFLEPSQDDLLDAAWKQAEKGNIRPEDLAVEGTLGFADMVVNAGGYYLGRLFRREPGQAVRAALVDFAGGDDTWNVDGPCDVFDQLAGIGPEADVVVAGHTHLRRQKRFGGSGALYLNTGTWARLMRFTQARLASDDTFAPIWRALSARSMDALDALPDDVILNQPTVAVIRPETGKTRAALCEAGETGEPALVTGANWQAVGS